MPTSAHHHTRQNTLSFTVSPSSFVPPHPLPSTPPPSGLPFFLFCSCPPLFLLLQRYTMKETLFCSTRVSPLAPKLRLIVRDIEIALFFCSNLFVLLFMPPPPPHTLTPLSCDKKHRLESTNKRATSTTPPPPQGTAKRNTTRAVAKTIAISVPHPRWCLVPMRRWFHYFFFLDFCSFYCDSLPCAFFGEIKKKQPPPPPSPAVW